MKLKSWKGKAFKKLTFGKTKHAGRNYSGSITIYHRGGGSKRLHRRIDFQRNTLSRGVVERIEYDPNRSSRIALIRWDTNKGYPSLQLTDEPTTNQGDVNLAFALKSEKSATLDKQQSILGQTLKTPGATKDTEQVLTTTLCMGRPTPQYASDTVGALFSYILACEKLKSGDEIINLHLVPQKVALSQDLALRISKTSITSTTTDAPVLNQAQSPLYENSNFVTDRRLYQKNGNNCILAKLPVGSLLHNIEIYPGQGGKLVRAAGTFAQLVQKFDNMNKCMVRLPSGRKLLLDSRCRATIGVVSNTAHNTRKLKKAGQNRWLGRLPVVRGVAMNPIDHPHGGGEGRTKGGRPSVSPWGKSAKGARKISRKLAKASQSLRLVFGMP